MAAQTEEQKLQALLFDELEKSDVKVSGEAAEKMQENIKNDRGNQPYLGVGSHNVVVSSVELIKANSGTLGMKFNVENSDGRGNATMWLSEAALPYTIENVSRLMVHNAPEGKKDEVRVFMANVNSAKEIFSIVAETLKTRAKKNLAFEAVLNVTEDKSGRTYTNAQGEVKPSLNSSIQTWHPKETVVEKVIETTGGTKVDDKDGVEIPF